MNTVVRTRIAPTPSGYLHTGNAFNFLLTEALVLETGGTLRLRIDDLDSPRIRDEYLEDIFKTLSWLGMMPDEGPKDVPDHVAHFTQQLRIQEYELLLERLVSTGQVFACTCSRAEVLRDSPDGQYTGRCRGRGLPLATKDAAWRFRTNAGETAGWQDGISLTQNIELYRHVRDFIIRRRDGLPAYHVASLCDDVAYGINLIVRGEDLLYSTAAQLYIARFSGLESFLKSAFYHHPLLKNDSGDKLSKSAGSDSLHAARVAGISAKTIREKARDWYSRFLPAGR